MLKILLFLAFYCQQDDWAKFKEQSQDKDIWKRTDSVALIAKYKNLQMAQALMPMLADKHPGCVRAAVLALGSVNDPEAVKFLLGDPLKKFKPQILEAFGLMKDASTVDTLLAALNDSSPEIVSLAAWALSRIGDAKAADPIAKLWEKKNWLVRCAVLEALREIAPSKAKPMLDEAVKDKAYQVRMTAAWSAPFIIEDSAALLLADLINDRDWRVRAAVIEACLDLRKGQVVGLLIDRMGKEDGRLLYDILNALMDLTGKNLGTDPKPWAEWWAAVKDKFQAEPKGDPKKRKKDGAKAAAGSTAAFFNVPIVSTRVAFVLDLSGSMRDEYVDENGKSTGKSKLAVAQDEMIKTINGFKDEVRFNILLLGCDNEGGWDVNSKVWKKGLSKADKRGKTDATGFVSKQESKGWTNIWDALMLAYRDDDVDTIFLMSDGGASRGSYTLADHILDMIVKENKYRKINIHTIHFDFPNPKTGKISTFHTRLMEGLADATGGTYTPHFGGK